jgi:hypothetical protein
VLIGVFRDPRLFLSFRLLFMTFHGKERFEISASEPHGHEEHGAR